MALSHRDCILWVDFSRSGIIMCDVLAELPDQPSLSFMCLPPSQHQDLQHQVPPGDFWRHRSVAVCNGVLKFITIDRTATLADCDVTIWSLNATGYLWQKEETLRVLNCLANPPMYPLLNGADTDVLYFTIFRGVTRKVYAVNRRNATSLCRAPINPHDYGVYNYTPYVGSEVPRFVTDQLGNGVMIRLH